MEGEEEHQMSLQKSNFHRRKVETVLPVKNLRFREPVVAGVQGYGLLTVHISVLCIFYVCSLA